MVNQAVFCPKAYLFYKLIKVKFVVKAASMNFREKFVYYRQQIYWTIVLEVSYIPYFEEDQP